MQPERTNTEAVQETTAVHVLRCPNGHAVGPEDTECATCGTVCFAPPAPPSVPNLPVFPGFEILAELGRGGMGVVYKARQNDLKRVVALKVIRSQEIAGPEERQRFRSEAEALARFHHANIVQVHTFGEHLGLPYMVMEYVEGGTLRQLLARGPLPPREAARWIALLASAVHVAHQHGIIHRDLKPDNVLIGADGQARITDFGLAKRLEASSVNTPSGAILGTPSYMAPEQARGDVRAVGPATDIFALGAILYEMLAGKPPFLGTTVVDTLHRILHAEPQSTRRLRPDISSDLEFICLKCLEKDPAHRYPDGQALALDLERYLSDQPILPLWSSWNHRLRKLLRRRRGLITAVASAAVLGLVLLAVLADGGAAVPGGQAVRDVLDRRGWSFLRPVPTRTAIAAQASAIRLSLQQTFDRNHVHGPFVGFHLINGRTETPNFWTQGQALLALAACPEATDEQLRPYAASFELLFHPDDTLKLSYPPFLPDYGWVGDEKTTYHAAPPGLWILAALARFLSREAVFTPAQREHHLDMVKKITQTYNSYKSTDEQGRFLGAWNFYPKQENTRGSNRYASAMALLALLELQRAGLPWDGSQEQCKVLLRDTAAQMIREMEWDPQRHRHGWKFTIDREVQWSQGITYITAALLLRAEAEAGIELPDGLVSSVPSWLAECESYDYSHPGQRAIIGFSPYKDPAGKSFMPSERSVNFLWYPWATLMAAQYLDRCDRTANDPLDRNRVQRILGHLVLKLGPDVQAGAGSVDWAYVSSENLLGLDFVR